jgi:1-acyl-sn-glycerol-3-phosphate acyltransferase
MIYSILRNILLLIYKSKYKITYEGLENLPPDGGYVFASNHLGYADPVLVSLPVRKRFYYMAKKELFKNPFFGLLIRVMGAFPVNRGEDGLKAVDKAAGKLKFRRRNLLIFPEGTRSKDGTVGRGKSGAALIAARVGADIIPVGIIYKGKLKTNSEITVRYGQKIHIGDVGGKPSSSEIKQLKSLIMERIVGLVTGT